MPVLIFDEIDTGISGKAANAVAEKLNGIQKIIKCYVFHIYQVLQQLQTIIIL